MTDLIDTRNFRKGAVTMLKNGSSIEKNLKRTLGTNRLKSVNSLSMPIYPDAVSSPNTGEAATISSHTLLSLSTDLHGIPSSEVGPKSIKHQITRVNSSYIRRSQENQIKIFAEKCWEEFQKRAVNPYKIPLDIREYEFPSKYLNEAIKSLVDFTLLPTQKKNLLEIYDERDQSITWKTFKKVMFSSFNIPLGPYESQLEPQTLTSSYSQLIEKQEVASNTVPHEVTTALEVEQVAAAVRLKGKMVPVRYLKDAFVSVVTEDSRAVASADPVEQEKSVGSRSFTRSYSDSVFSVNSAANVSNVNPRNPLGEHLSAPLQKQTVLELVDPSQEYSQKWLRMKKLRDERFRRETSKRLRFEVLNAFSRIVLNATREETGQSLAKSDYDHQTKVFSLAQKSHEMIKSCKDNTRSQYSKTVLRKKMEYKYMKETLSNSTTTFRSILYEENEMRKLERDHTITELDPHTSSIVETPDALTQKLKSAKSQKEFTTAQKAIQQHYEKTLSDRIAHYTSAKQQHPSSYSDASYGIPYKSKLQSSTVSFTDSLSRDDDLSKISSPDDLETISKIIRNNLANSPRRMLSTMAYSGPSIESSGSFQSTDMTRIIEEDDLEREAAMIAWQNSKTPKNFRFKSAHSVVIK